jgi:hypothetical protein
LRNILNKIELEGIDQMWTGGWQIRQIKQQVWLSARGTVRRRGGWSRLAVIELIVVQQRLEWVLVVHCSSTENNKILGLGLELVLELVKTGQWKSWRSGSKQDSTGTHW